MNVGHVYVVRTTLTRPPKDKITICICAAENLFFWINTDPRPHGVGQLQLVASDHDALTHECYLDCSRVTTFSEAEMAAAGRRGGISKDLAGRIATYLAESPPKTLPGKHLRIAIDNLKAYEP